MLLGTKIIILLFIIVLILIFVLLIYTFDFTISIVDFPLAVSLTLVLFMFFIVPHLSESIQNDLHYAIVGSDSEYIKSTGITEVNAVILDKKMVNITDDNSKKFQVTVNMNGNTELYFIRGLCPALVLDDRLNTIFQNVLSNPNQTQEKLFNALQKGKTYKLYISADQSVLGILKDSDDKDT